MELLPTLIYPVYCLTEVPQDYYDEFEKHARYNLVDWKVITSLEPGPNLEDLQIGTERQKLSTTNYDNSTLAEIYNHMKNHCKPELVQGITRRFTNFTFIVIDKACIRSKPQECIVCCDAPDDDDDDESGDLVRLKKLPLPIEGAMPLLCPLEQLELTPGEVLNSFKTPPGMVRHVLPHPHYGMTKKEESVKEMTYRHVTAAEARRNKCIGIFSPWCNDVRMTTAVAIPLKECLLASRMHRISNEFHWRATAGMLEAGPSFWVPEEGDFVDVENNFEPPPGETGILVQAPSSGDAKYYVTQYFGGRLSHIMDHIRLRQRHIDNALQGESNKEAGLASELSEGYESGDE